MQIRVFYVAIKLAAFLVVVLIVYLSIMLLTVQAITQPIEKSEVIGGSALPKRSNETYM
jgi:cell division protein FtsL